ncbi:hypothetical protein Enr10x_37540 [Gimesia panareensis]|uniref:BON domain-containing protein n=1 Tax=Gimesia panareensis TaxID=2527978 RepID=A0A517Q9V6_9PLAN|nr:hypothetical protein [Gimesia panareensis]QDT28412.1 hypothetical protein Enr10x_37540 [Gimesia panareensis]
MTAKHAFLTVLISIVIFALLGAVGSQLVHVLFPNYYRAVFRIPESSLSSPAQVGMQLGITQGAGLGVFLALGILGITAWQARAQTSPNIETAATTARQGFWHGKLIWALVTLMLVVFCSAVTFVAGGIMAQQQLYLRMRAEKQEILAQVLSENDYPGLKSEFSSAAQVYLTGTVVNEEQWEHLRQQLVQACGTDEADKMIRLVEIKQGSQ